MQQIIFCTIGHSLCFLKECFHVNCMRVLVCVCILCGNILNYSDTETISLQFRANVIKTVVTHLASR